MSSISEEISSLDVTNIYLYIGDAVRWDKRPKEVSKMGYEVKTISSSIHSPTSFASIATGRYPPKSGTFSFDHTIPKKMFRIFDLPVETRFLNSIFAHAERMHGGDHDPIYDVLRCDSSNDGGQLSFPEEPFLIAERGPGGHAPYGDFDGTAVDYYLQRGSEERQLREDYNRSIELDAAFFQNRLEKLEDAGILDDTLVIYTSDHGELLGEGGGIGHNSPMRPELVYVPTVYIHPDIPSEETTSGTHHHVDITATICAVLGHQDLLDPLDGTSATAGIVESGRPCYYHKNFAALPGNLQASLVYDGVWDAGGGYVFPKSSRLSRLAVLAGLVTQSPKRGYIRRNIHRTALSHIASERIYGTPKIERAEAISLLKQVDEEKVQSVKQTLSSDAEDRLSDLGYI